MSDEFEIEIINSIADSNSDFELPSLERLPPIDGSEFEQVGREIQSSPDPQKFQSIYDRADSLTKALKMPVDEALRTSKTIEETPDFKNQINNGEQYFFLQRKINELRYQQSAGDKTPETQTKIIDLKKQQSKYQRPEGIGGTAQGFISGMGEQGAGGLRGAYMWALGALTWPFRKVFGEELKIGPEGKTIQEEGATIGLTPEQIKKITVNPLTGVAEFGKEYTSGIVGPTYGTLVDQGVDPEIASNAAWALGTVLSAVNLIPAGRLLPGASRFGEQAFQAAARDLLINGGFARLAKVWVARVAAIGIEQASIGFTEASIDVLTQEAAKRYSNSTKGTDVKESSFLELVKEIGIEGGTQALAGTAIGAVTAGIETRKVYRVSESLRGKINEARADATANIKRLSQEVGGEAKAESVIKSKPFKEQMAADAARIRMEEAKTIVDTAMNSEKPNIEIAKTAIDNAIIQTTKEIETSEILNPDIINRIEELTNMSRVVEQSSIEEKSVVPGDLVVTKDGKIAGKMIEQIDENGIPSYRIDTGGGTEKIVSIDQTNLWMKREEQEAKWGINRPTDSDINESLVESGRWVPDLELGKHSEKSWAKAEISEREDLRDLASYLADTGQATAFDSFMAAAKDIETTPHNDEYYKNIWDTAPKTEIAVDETGAIDTEAVIDTRIAAEEKTAKVPKVDQWIAELNKAGPGLWDPKVETVREILEAKEQKTPSAEAGEDLTLTEIANATRRTKQSLVKRVIRDVLKPPGPGIGYEAINKIRAMQEPYTAKETKNLEGMKKAIRSYQEKHPGEQLIPEVQAILNQKSIKDTTAEDLLNLWREQKEIRIEGAKKEKERRVKIKERRVQMATDMLAEIPGGMTVERLDEYASITTKTQEKKLARKGFLKFNSIHPLRLFKGMGKAFEKAFWDDRKIREGKEAARINKHDKEIRDLYERTGVKSSELLKKAPGTDYYVDTLLYYYGQMKDPDGRRAILWGNDEDEAKITRAISELPQKYKDFMDGFMELTNKNYADVEKVQVEVNGVAAPQIKHYLPIRREQDFGQAMAQELSTEASIREGARMASLQKGFTIQRKTFKEGTQQSRIRTDLLNIMAEQITKESRYVELEEWARDMSWLLGGKSKEGKKVIEAIKQKWGKPAVTFLQDYVNAVVRPGTFNGADFGGLMSRVFRGLSDAALLYKVGAIVSNVEGPFRALAALNFNQYQYALSGLWKASTQINKASEFMYSKSPEMRAIAESEAIDPALREGMQIKHTNTELGVMIQRAHNAIRKGGYAGLQAMQKWTIVAEWTSVYQAELQRTGDDVIAVKAANDSVFLHQPSGNLADAPRMYWLAKKNIILSYLVRFTRAVNQTGQMLLYDLPKEVKAGHIGKASGILIAFAIAATINGYRRRKRPPENEEELLEDGIAGLGETVGSMTFGAGQALQTGIEGKGFITEIKPLEPIKRIGAVGKDIWEGDINQRQVWQALNLIGQWGGLPTPAAENVFRSLYDTEEEIFRFDPVELLGRKLKE
jgi:hypothetical protein